MEQGAASNRRVNIEDVVDISRADRDLTVNDADVDEDVGTVLSENFGMMGHLVKVRRTLVRLAHSYAGMWVDASTDDHSCEVEGMGIGMALDCGCHIHSVAGNMTMDQGDHKAAVDSP